MKIKCTVAGWFPTYGAFALHEIRDVEETEATLLLMAYPGHFVTPTTAEVAVWDAKALTEKTVLETPAILEVANTELRAPVVLETRSTPSPQIDSKKKVGDE